MSKRCFPVYLAGLIFAASGIAALAAEPNASPSHECPMMDSHAAGVDSRGDKVMGFDHMKTRHHFRLTPDGGVIQVEANDSGDKASVDQIRMHLRHVAAMFTDGNFTAPMLIHAQDPPGMDVLQRVKKEITYTYEEQDHGAAVHIHSVNAEAIEAIHAFLRFQIQDHRTGDPLDQ